MKDAAARRLSATEAQRRFSEVVDRIANRRERFLIERKGKAVCEMIPARRRLLNLAELAELLGSLPKPDAGYWTDVSKAAGDQPPVPERKAD